MLTWRWRFHAIALLQCSMRVDAAGQEEDFAREAMGGATPRPLHSPAGPNPLTIPTTLSTDNLRD